MAGFRRCSKLLCVRPWRIRISPRYYWRWEQRPQSWTKEVKWWNGFHINRGRIQNKWEYALVNDNDGLIISRWLTWHWIWHYIVSCWLWFRSIPWINDSWIPKLSESYYRISTSLSSGRTRSSCVTVTCLAAAFASLNIATVDIPNCPLRLVRQKQSSLRARILKEYGDGLQ